MKKFEKLSRYLRCGKNKIQIEYQAKCNSGNFFDYSDAYLSILHYIDSNPEISKMITSKQEMDRRPVWNGHFYYDDEEDENENVEMFSKKEITYRVTDSKEFKLNEYITCEFINKNIEKSKKNHKDEYQTVNIECYSIVLSTKKKDIKYIQNFVDELYTKYIDFKNESTFKGKMYFSYEGKNKKNKPVWKEFRWQTNKTFDNIFLENKTEILSNIDKLAKMKNFNKRIGRSNQTHILIWGNDFGCGKTSLLKAICNVQFPERHIVNINLGKIKTCKELEDIFMKTTVNGRVLKTKQCIYIIDEIEKCCPILLKDYKKDNNFDFSSMFKKYSSKFNMETDEEKNDMKKMLDSLTTPSSCSPNDKNDELNLGFILSLIDGPIEYQDRVMIFTANDKDKLHPALIRPGRIDIDIHLKKATIGQIVDIISFIFEYNLSENTELMTKLQENIKDEEISPSAVYEACLVNHSFDDNKELFVEKTIDFLINKINNN